MPNIDLYSLPTFTANTNARNHFTDVSPKLIKFNNADFSYATGNGSYTNLTFTLPNLFPDAQHSYDGLFGSCQIYDSDGNLIDSRTDAYSIGVPAWYSGDFYLAFTPADSSVTAFDVSIFSGDVQVDFTAGTLTLADFTPIAPPPFLSVSSDYKLKSTDSLAVLFDSGFSDIKLTADARDNHIVTNNGNSTVLAGAGSDLITARDGDDSIDGGDGNDTISGGVGNNVILGGVGSDFITSRGFYDTLDGGSGNDTISGGWHFSSIKGGDGNDSITSAGFFDTIDGGSGNDSILFDEGVMVSVVGGLGDDSITVNATFATVVGGDGADLIQSYAVSSISGGVGNDTISSGSDSDKIDGGDGNDVIDSGSGRNIVSGGKGNDSILSGFGNDKLDGGDGNDTIVSGNGRDSILGGVGNDSIVAGIGADTIDGGKGDDVIVSNGANSKLSGGDDNDLISLVSIDNSVISSFDTLNGGAGNDTLTVTGFSGKHNLIGGAGNDTLTHSDLNGSATLDGGAGSDILISKNSSDVLIGGADSDIFNLSDVLGVGVFNKTNLQIIDFKSGIDKLVFTDSLTPVALDTSHFFTAVTSTFTFTTSEPSYAYNTKMGALFYDADGSEFGEQVQIALIANKAQLLASDILV